MIFLSNDFYPPFMISQMFVPSGELLLFYDKGRGNPSRWAQRTLYHWNKSTHTKFLIQCLGFPNFLTPFQESRNPRHRTHAPPGSSSPSPLSSQGVMGQQRRHPFSPLFAEWPTHRSLPSSFEIDLPGLLPLPRKVKIQRHNDTSPVRTESPCFSLSANVIFSPTEKIEIRRKNPVLPPPKILSSNIQALTLCLHSSIWWMDHVSVWDQALPYILD